MPRANPEWRSERLRRPVETTPLPADVAALLEVRAQSHPQRPFLVFFDDGEELTFLVDEVAMCSRVFSLHGRYPASTLLRTQPPPSRL